MIIAAITASFAIWADVQPTTAISYEHAIRCAGVTQAASELEGGESRYGRALADSALYWSLVAIQVSEANQRLPELSEAELTRARVLSVRKLSAGDKPTRALLQTCRQQTPRLDG